MARKNAFIKDGACNICHETGVYRGCREPPGVAVICHCCNGTGKGHSLGPFTGRKVRSDVEWVQPNRWNEPHISDADLVRRRISYQDFLNGKFPPKG